MNQLEIDEKTARVSDLLEQIDRLNQMIEFHKNKSGELSMMRQYEEMRNEFLTELKEILTNFKIEIKGLAA